MEDSRSCVRGMDRVVFMALMVVVASCKPASCQGVTGGPLVATGGGRVGAPGGEINLPIPIPTSRWFYDGSDASIDSCARDEVSINGTCYRLLTQGPCKPSDFVLLDAATLEGFCAPRLCAPDRIFVFSDQLCHDPFSNTHCPGDQELFQTAFGTPICQCPDGYLEAGGGRCVPPLTLTTVCPPGQVLWTNTTRVQQMCGGDPCGRLNIDRQLPSPPFVPALANGVCYQLGQGMGVCPPGSFYSLNLEVRRGVCSLLEEAGYITLDPDTHRLFIQLYGHFTPLNHGFLMSTPLLPPPQAQAMPKLPIGGADRHGMKPGMKPVGEGVKEPKGNVVKEVGPRRQEGDVTEESKRPFQHQFQVPVHSTHYIRGNNLGPTRGYEFNALTKHFTLTRLALTRLHSSHARNHLIRPRPPKPLRPTPPVKTQRASERFSAQGLLAAHERFRGHPADTRDADDDNESSEAHERDRHTHDGPDGGRWAREGAERREERHRRATEEKGVVETRLVSCRAGARRHVNAKCRHTLLPFSYLPPSTFEETTGGEEGVLRRRRKRRRRRRSVAPITPALSCPENTFFSIQRECVISSLVSASLSPLH